MIEVEDEMSVDDDDDDDDGCCSPSYTFEKMVLRTGSMSTQIFYFLPYVCYK